MNKRQRKKLESFYDGFRRERKFLKFKRECLREFHESFVSRYREVLAEDRKIKYAHHEFYIYYKHHKRET